MFWGFCATHFCSHTLPHAARFSPTFVRSLLAINLWSLFAQFPSLFARFLGSFVFGDKLGRMIGLEYKLKSESSLFRKIMSDLDDEREKVRFQSFVCPFQSTYATFKQSIVCILRPFTAICGHIWSFLRHSLVILWSFFGRCLAHFGCLFG